MAAAAAPRARRLLVGRRIFSRGAIALLAVLLCRTQVVSAQANAQDRIAQAERLRDAGNFAAAVDLLRAQLAQNPKDGEAARLLAQTLYWQKDIPGARAAYESARAQHPEDTTLQLQYARMLAETGEHARARELLTPLVDNPATRAEAETDLGMIDYWEGNLSGARNSFTNALQANPNQEEAKRQLQEIRSTTVPWLRFSANGWSDNQPLDWVAGGIEAGWFATPLTQLTLRVEPTHYWANSLTQTAGLADLGVTHYVPAARLDLELSAGAVRRWQGGDTWDWTGRAALGFRLPKHVTVRGQFERTPYFHTTASLSMPLMVNTVAGVLHFGDVRGWLGEAAFEQQRFPDNNAVQTGYGWLLAPLVHRSAVVVQAGYAFADSNADSTRFVLAQPTQPFLPSDPRFDLAGVYSPYFTPNHQVIHSVLAAFELRPARNATFRVDGSYGFHATDNAPFFAVSGGQAVLSTYVRTFTPWNVRASLKIPLGEEVILEPSAEMGRTAFYSWVAAGLQLTYHLPGAVTPPARTK
jgi:tetratricopeptide (TPR) repeat protein